MSFRRQTIRDYYLHDTRVENVFINEYMTDAPGDYVKVYLFALMYAEINVPITNRLVAKQLALAEEDVLKAWSYWEKLGVVKKHYKNKEDTFNYEVELLNIRDMVYGRKGREKKKEPGKKVPERARAIMEDSDLARMYGDIERIAGRPFEGKEPEEILSWIENYNIKPELVIFAYTYCVNNRKKNNYKYVGAVLREWAERGFKTIEETQRHLEETDNRHFLYKRVLKALGLLRNPTEQEKRIMDNWFDELGFDLNKVLEACGKTSGISNPNINYVNSILKAWSQGDTGGAKREPSSSGPAGISQSTLINMVMKSYDEDRMKNEAQAKKRREEVYQAVPRIKEIEEESRSLGMEISRLMLSGGPQGKKSVREIKDKVEHLSREKAFLLTDHNFNIDYMDIPYTCKNCKDTGVLDTGERCTCFAEKLANLERP